MIGIYFSGTGNTKHCIDEFLKDNDSDTSIISIEEPAATSAIKENDFIVFAYPVYFSNIPKIVRDFIEMNKESFKGKEIFIIATMGLFSGDGAGCSARLFKKYGAKIAGGLHLKMPDCVGDVKLLKKPLSLNKQIVQKADRKINNSAGKLRNEKPTQEGLSIFHQIAGLICQRLWFFNKTKKYSVELKIDKSKCIECGLCGEICPMNNFESLDGKIEPTGKCTMCYRCFSNCPEQAITLLGKKVHEQCKFENYSSV